MEAPTSIRRTQATQCRTADRQLFSTTRAARYTASTSAVLNSLPSVSSQRSYDHAIREFIEWYCSEPRLAFNNCCNPIPNFPRAGPLCFINHQSPACGCEAARLRAADSGLLSPDLAAGIRRVKGAKKHGVRTGNWLTAEQGKTLLQTVDRTSSVANAITPW